jgi:hypothetical protein
MIGRTIHLAPKPFGIACDILLEITGGQNFDEGQVSDFAHCRQRSGLAIECDGLEECPFVHTIGSASRLSPGLHGKARDKLQGQALSVAAWFAFELKRHLDVFNELPYLRFWKTEYQPSQRRNKSF